MEFKRRITETLKSWKEAPDRKPVLLRGARQTGKTWVMETFGKECFEHYVKFTAVRRNFTIKYVARQNPPPEHKRELSADYKFHGYPPSGRGLVRLS